MALSDGLDVGKSEAFSKRVGVTRMPWRLVAEWLGFQAVWLACAVGAARGLNWPGVAAAAIFLIATLSARGWAKPEVKAVLASGVFGAVAETLLTTTGLVLHGAAPSLTVAGPGFDLPPAWIIALWLAFGATIPAMEAVLGRTIMLNAALVGAVTGPLAYLAGVRLGALQFPAGAWPALAALALLWALALPLLLHGYRKAAR